MDTRTTPFGNHPDGGKITELKQDEPIPNHMMPLSEEAQKILEKIPMVSRVEFIINSRDSRLLPEREFLLTKIKKEQPALFVQLEYNRCKKDYDYWLTKYFMVVHK